MKSQQNYHYLKPLARQNLKRGFTLTELLIVIVITGITPAIVMPWLLELLRESNKCLVCW